MNMFCDVTENIRLISDRIAGLVVSLQLITISDRTAMKWRVSLRGSSSSCMIFCDKVSDEEVFIDLTTLVSEVVESAGVDGVGNPPSHPQHAGKGSPWPPTWATRFGPLGWALCVFTWSVIAGYVYYWKSQ